MGIVQAGQSCQGLGIRDTGIPYLLAAPLAPKERMIEKNDGSNGTALKSGNAGST